MVPNIVCCWFTLAWNDSSSSCTVWEKIITKRCIKNEHCRQKQILAPKPHNWCSNVSTQNWGILLWIPIQWCTPTRPYHRLCDKNWVSDERITSCPMLAVGKQCPKIDKDPDDVVSTFIDKYVSAVISPIASENENNIKLMENLQKHTYCDYSCRNKSWCFGFPKPPTTKILISRPPIDDNDEMIENAKSVLQTVQNTLKTVDIHNIFTQHFLQDINLDVGTYIDALKISKIGPNVILQWNPHFYKCIQSWHVIFMGRKCGPPICN